MLDIPQPKRSEPTGDDCQMFKRDGFRNISSVILSVKFYIILYFLAAVCAAGLELYTVLLSVEVATGLVDQSEILPAKSDNAVYNLTKFLVCLLVLTIFRILMQYLVAMIPHTFAGKLTTLIVLKILCAPFHVVRGLETKSLASAVTIKVDSLTKTIIYPLLIFPSVAISLCAIAYGIVTISGIESLVFLLIILTAYILYNLSTKGLLKDNSKIASQAINNIVQWAGMSVSTARQIRVDGLKKFYIKKFQKSVHEYRRVVYKNQFLANFPRYGIEAFFCILLLGFLGFYDSIDTLSLPVLLGLGFGMQRLLPQVQQLMATYLTFKSNYYMVADVLSYLELPEERALGSTSIERFGSTGLFVKNFDIRIENFDICNDGLPRLNFGEMTLPEKGLIAVKGASGEGKSTFLDVLAGLYPMYLKNIFINSVTLSEGSLKEFQALLAYVDQEPFLINASIKDNVFFGHNSADVSREKLKFLEEIMQVLELNQIPGICPETDKLGEMGMRLSNGQRQRVVLARALIKKPRLLILDEALSGLEKVLRVKILDYILSMDVLVFLVSHNEDDTAHALNVIEVKGGEVNFEINRR